MARIVVMAVELDAFMAIPLLGSQARVPRRCPRAGVTDRTLCSLTLRLTLRSRQAQKRYPTGLDVWAERAKQAPTPSHHLPAAGCLGSRRLCGSAQMRRVVGRRNRSPGQPSAAAVPAETEPLTIFVDLAITPPVPAESAQDPEHAVLLATREALRDHVRESSTSMTGTVVRSRAQAIGDVPGSSSSSTAITRLAAAGRPCRSTRQLPEKNLPDPLRLGEDARWAASEPVRRELGRRRSTVSGPRGFVRV